MISISAWVRFQRLGLGLDLGFWFSIGFAVGVRVGGRVRVTLVTVAVRFSVDGERMGSMKTYKLYIANVSVERPRNHWHF